MEGERERERSHYYCSGFFFFFTFRMRVARLLLCYVLLEDYSTNLGGATITSDAARQDASATNPTLSGIVRRSGTHRTSRWANYKSAATVRGARKSLIYRRGEISLAKREEGSDKIFRPLCLEENSFFREYENEHDHSPLILK